MQRRREELRRITERDRQGASEAVGVGLGVDALLGEMVQDDLVCPGVPGLLLHERFDGRFQLGVVDQ